MLREQNTSTDVVKGVTTTSKILLKAVLEFLLPLRYWKPVV